MAFQIGRLVGVLALLAGMSVGAAPLFENGNTTWRVMRQTDADCVVKYAVTELTRALKLVSGATFAVVEGDAPQPGDIFVGVDGSLPAPGDEVVVNRMDGGALRLVGNESRAALHAVYAFLQRELGIRWVWPGDDGEFMPTRNAFEVPEDLEWRHTPTVRYRGFHCCGDWFERDAFLVWMARNFATTHRHGFKNDAQEKLGFYNMYSTHNANLSGNAELFAAHPEYYSERNGKRSKSNICFSSDGAVDEVVAALRSSLKAFSDAGHPLDVLSIFPADNQDYCQCELCRRTSVSTGWFRFYNKCVARLKPDCPGLRFATIAYQGYRGVPDCAIPDTEFVEYATHGRCNFHPLGCDPSVCPNSAADHARMAAWDAAGVPVGQYAYEYDTFSKHGVYLPFLSLVEETVNQAAAHRHVVLLPEVGMSPRNGPAVVVGSVRNRLSEYFYALKMWDASLTKEAWLADMTRTVFGPAAADVAAYLRTMDGAWCAQTGHVGILGDAIKRVPGILTDEVRARAAERLAAAAAALDAAEAGGRDVTRCRAALDREDALFAQWTTLADKAAGKATTVYAPRLPAAGAIGEGRATGCALTGTNGVAGAVRVRVAWAGEAPGRGGRDVDKIVVEFLGDALEGAALTVDVVSPGNDGSYAFRREADGTLSASHVSGTGVLESYAPAWTAENAAGVARLILPAATFETAPLVGGTWGIRFGCAAGAETLAFPHVEGMTADTVFMNRDAADRPLLYYYGDSRNDVGDVPALRLAAAECGYRMTVATNDAGLAEIEDGTMDFRIRMGSGNFPSAFKSRLLDSVSNGGVAIFTSYWDMGLQNVFYDSSFRCRVGNSDQSGALSDHRATFVLDAAWIRAPNDLYSTFANANTPVYTQLPDDEACWTVCLRTRGRTAYAGGDHPYLMYRRYGKGFVVVGGESIAGEQVFYSLFENFRALAEALPAEEPEAGRVIHYVDANGTNPVPPYDSVLTAATDVFSALDVAGSGDEVRILPGEYPVAKSVDITVNNLVFCGATGNPKDVVIRAVTSSNRCMRVNAGPRTLVHSLTLTDGRGGDGGPAPSRTKTYAACLAVADLSRNKDGNDMLGKAHLGGVVSNCVIRGGRFTGKSCASAGAFAYGSDALVTHCVITNNVSGGGYSDNGWFGATGLCLGGGARAEHCLIARNKINDTSNSGFYQAAVHVGEGSVLRYSTVYGNVSSLVGGVNVSGSGRFEKCVVAGNTIVKSDTTDPRHAVWGAFDFGIGATVYRKSDGALQVAAHLAAEERRHFEVAAQAVINASDCAEADLGPGSLTVAADELFTAPARWNFMPVRLSPTVDAVSPDNEAAGMPAVDLTGSLRLVGGGYDLGAVECQAERGEFCRGLVITVR